MWWFFYQIELVGKQLVESIKPLAFGSWFYAFLSLFANSFNLVRYSSRGGQENQLGWRLVGFLVHHSLNILRSNTQSNEVSPRGILKYTRLRLVYFRMPLGDTSLLLVLLFRNTTLTWFFLYYFRQNSHVAFLMNQEEVSAAVKCKWDKKRKMG